MRRAVSIALALLALMFVAAMPSVPYSENPTPSGGVLMIPGAGAPGVSNTYGGSPNPGPPPTSCANQLILNYSNNCALIAQAWGE